MLHAFDFFQEFVGDDGEVWAFDTLFWALVVLSLGIAVFKNPKSILPDGVTTPSKA
jgi:hypothetical protein